MVPKAVKIISANVKKQIAQLKEDQSSTTDQELAQLLEVSNQIELTRPEFQQIRHQSDFPYTTSEVYKMYLRLINWKMEEDFNASIVAFHSKASNFKHYGMKFVTVPDSIEFPLELFFDQFQNFQDISKISRSVAKMYMIMKISYFMKINNKSQKSLDALENYKKMIHALQIQLNAIERY